MKKSYLNNLYGAIFALIASTNLAGCIPLVDLYVVGDASYQFDVKQEVPGASNADGDTLTAGTAEADGLAYGGGLGLGLSVLGLYAGGEVTFVSTETDGNIQRIGRAAADAVDNITVNDTLEEKWILNAMADAGIYISDDLLLFARAGYVYVDSDIERGTDTTSLDGLRNLGDIEESAFAIGAGMEYELFLGVGLRAYYLRHEGKRNANEVRTGVVWRF
jgi:opacity protein-like surface antigen